MAEPITASGETASTAEEVLEAKSRLIFRTQDPGDRLSSLDFLRGGAIFFMVLLNALAFYESVPAWLKHAPWHGLTLPDLGVPIFLFALGISYRISFFRWLERNGKMTTILHFVLRYLILWAFGFFGEYMVFGHFTWGVLAMIGAVGLYCLPFLFLPASHRLLLSSFLLAAYQLALLAGLPVYFVDDGLGGPLATFAWGFTVIVATSCGPWMVNKAFHQKMASVLAAGLTLIILGFALSLFIPFNKHQVSFSYVIFTTGLSIIIFLASFILTDIWQVKIPVFTVLGKNPLLVYMISGLLTLGLNAITPDDASFPLLVGESLVILMINYIVATWLHRQGISLRV